MADGNIDNLNFGVILSDTEFDQQIESVKTKAEQFNTEVSKLLEFQVKISSTEIIKAEGVSNAKELAGYVNDIVDKLNSVDGKNLLIGDANALNETLQKILSSIDELNKKTEETKGKVKNINGELEKSHNLMSTISKLTGLTFGAAGIKSFISVNVSPKDFLRLDVVSEMKSLVEEFGIKPEKLRIEITETAVTTENVDMFKIISDLREYGFIVEMDDFGSGYSSLNLLKDISLDLIKIDMQFLKDSERNMKAGLIIKNIINMSEDLGIDTLTEGVETAKQFEKLYDMGCKLYQGYYFSKPVPVEDFEKQWFD